ncbi:MAPEG family protein [Glacieibacterium frigidum]|uniref:MAPEG family protein n=1 Tax=Glacieibacterium frigidum TaxID=2593303 RepID=A0A552UJ56_9SPHN|nr:MAPEG family protein [Glacieibacterium frigidum]TRW18220.1 hypothetical protein FMM06_09010 [Glacieibacterium frigidum]
MIVTITTAGLCGLVLMALSVRVIVVRGSAKVSLGDGGNPLLLSRIRAHANFAEYVPIILILMGLIESFDGDRYILGIMGIALVLGRIAQAAGMGLPAPNPWRVVGTLTTFIILISTSVWALIISARLHGL